MLQEALLHTGPEFTLRIHYTMCIHRVVTHPLQHHNTFRHTEKSGVKVNSMIQGSDTRAYSNVSKK